MNAKQTKLINYHLNKLHNAKELIETAKSELEELHTELEADFDNKSEKWQEGEKGEETRSLIDSLSNAVNDAESADQSIDGSISNLEDIINNI